ncbi:hypothetical protein LIER_34781 [Lithospermum erythrorhizon]|uniref:SOSEKI DIX-like domain-containing protein n=1 Tax=Lithospermum erythrorhizon TaxID=34254 RepID=A0AAV3S285_LITER
MERRMKKYDRLVSPERAKVWTEKSPKYRYNDNMRNDISKNGSYSMVNGKKNDECEEQEQELAMVEHRSRKAVEVVYYLCRNQQLEQPHFIEVTLSSPDGLYLRDVIEKLNVLRGRGMTSLYSWSCKRNYKNGYVWHDLCEDDLILPTYGNDYVLKGSELFEESPSSDRFYSVGSLRVQTPKALPEMPSSRYQECSSSPSTPSSMNGRKMKYSDNDEVSPSTQRPDSLSASPESSSGKNSSENGSLSLTKYKLYKCDGLADASTQTDEDLSRMCGVQVTYISTNGNSPEPGKSEIDEITGPGLNEAPVTCKDSVIPPSSSCAPSDGRMDTLESLIRADASKLNKFKMGKGEEILAPSSSKVKASNVLIQLISCGSISVKDGSFGVIPSYKPSFLLSKFPSPLFSTSSRLGEIDLSDNPRFMGLKLEDKEYFSGSLIERSMAKDGTPALKRSSSYNADKGTKEFENAKIKEETTNDMPSKCIPRAIKASLLKQPRSESMRSPLSDGPRISSDRADSSRNITSSNSSRAGSKRFTEPTSTKDQHSRKSDSSRNQKENVIKIEES